MIMEIDKPIKEFKTLHIDEHGRRYVIDGGGRKKVLMPTTYYAINSTGYSVGIGYRRGLIDFFLSKNEVEF